MYKFHVDIKLIIIYNYNTHFFEREQQQMKETIYTIPLNEAFDEPSECPLCRLKDKLEAEAIDYALGAAMMEPDYRIISNEKGYCEKHFSMLFSKPNKLSLALVLDTHLEELRSGMEKLSKGIGGKSGLFKRPSAAPLTEYIESKTNSCLICDKLSKTMARYTDIFFDILKDDEAFKAKVEASKGFCLPHFKELLLHSEKKLSPSAFSEFSLMLTKKQLAELERIQEDIHKFTLKFDYRNADMDWGTAKDAPIRTIEKLTGSIIKCTDEKKEF